MRSIIITLIGASLLIFIYGIFGNSFNSKLTILVGYVNETLSRIHPKVVLMVVLTIIAIFIKFALNYYKKDNNE